MPKQFKFKQEPQYIFDGTQVIICYEDFEGLCRFAEFWLKKAHSSDFHQANFHDGQKVTNSGSSKIKPTHKLPDASELYVNRPVQFPPAKNALNRITLNSKIMNTKAGFQFGDFPLDFLSNRLSMFKKATQIFSTRDFTSLALASQFHQVCDRKPNVVVIIKSGQYIAGGYTEVPFESRPEKWYKHRVYEECSNEDQDGYSYDEDVLDGSHLKENENLSTFLFSVNRQKTYHLRDSSTALDCRKTLGPSFGSKGLKIADNYAADENEDWLADPESCFSGARVSEGKGVLFGSMYFSIDEYEVFQLE